MHQFRFSKQTIDCKINFAVGVLFVLSDCGLCSIEDLKTIIFNGCEKSLDRLFFRWFLTSIDLPKRVIVVAQRLVSNGSNIWDELKSSDLSSRELSSLRRGVTYPLVIKKGGVRIHDGYLSFVLDLHYQKWKYYYEGIGYKIRFERVRHFLDYLGNNKDYLAGIVKHKKGRRDWQYSTIYHYMEKFSGVVSIFRKGDFDGSDDNSPSCIDDHGNVICSFPALSYNFGLSEGFLIVLFGKNESCELLQQRLSVVLDFEDCLITEV